MANILTVTNSGLIRLKLEKILKETSHRLFEATNREELRLNSFSTGINLEDIDLIILDFPFNSNNKFNVLNYLSTNFSNIPIIIISSINSREIIMQAFELGAEDYILKPFDRITLLDRISPYVKEKDSDIKEGKSIFKRNYQSFISNLSLEINRATRGASDLTIGKFDSKQKIAISKLKRVREYVTEVIRDIDQAYVISQETFILILPVTDRSGFETLYERLEDLLKEIIENLEEIVEIEAVTFPEDITKDLDYKKIDSYQEEILEKLNLKK